LKCHISCVIKIKRFFPDWLEKKNASAQSTNIWSCKKRLLFRKIRKNLYNEYMCALRVKCIRLFIPSAFIFGCPLYMLMKIAHAFVKRENRNAFFLSFASFKIRQYCAISLLLANILKSFCSFFTIILLNSFIYILFLERI